MKWRHEPEDELPYDGKDRCPDCGEEFPNPFKGPHCICRDPLYIVIQPGHHIHIHCPVHGDVKIYGPRMHWLQSPPSGAKTTSRWFTEHGKASKSMCLTNSIGPL